MLKKLLSLTALGIVLGLPAFAQQTGGGTTTGGSTCTGCTLVSPTIDGTAILTGELRSTYNGAAVRPASQATAGSAITNNYAGLGEVDFWSTVNSSGGLQGFNFYQKLTTSTEARIARFNGDATYSEIDLSLGANIAYLYLDAVSLIWGTELNIPLLFISTNKTRITFPTTGGIAVHGTTSGSVKLATPAVAGTNEITLPAATGTIVLGMSGTTAAIGGSALIAGACASGTVAVTGSTTAMAVAASPVTYPGDGSYWLGYVSTNGTVTVKVCGAVAVTPVSSAYNVRVIQ